MDHMKIWKIALHCRVNMLMSVMLILAMCTGCTGKKKQCYSVTLCEEWPVVDESITSNYEMETDSSYYVLEKSSRFSSHWNKVTYVSSGGERSFNSILTIPKSSSLSLKNVKWNSIATKVRSWVYTEDKDGAVDNVKAYDIDGNLLYTQYYSQKEYEKGDLKKCVITYVDADGDTIQTYDKGASRAVVHLNDKGYRDIVYFQNAQGESCRNQYGFEKFEIEYNRQSGVSVTSGSFDDVYSHTCILLNDKYKERIRVNMDFLRQIKKPYPIYNIEIDGEVKTECSVSDSVTYVTTSFEKDGTSIPIDDKTYKIVSTYDAKGHLIKRACQNKNGENVSSMLVTVYTYDEYGFLVLTELLSSDEKHPVNGSLGWQKREYKYDDNHFLQEIIYYDPSGYIVKAPHESYYALFFEYDVYGRLWRVSRLGRSLNRYKDVLSSNIYNYSNDYFPQSECYREEGRTIYQTHYSYYKNGDEYYVGHSYSLEGKNAPAFDNLFEKVVMYDKQGNRIVRYLDDKENILKSDSFMNESEAFSLKDQIKGEKRPRYCVINTNRWRFEGYMLNGEPHGEGCIEWTESGEVLVGNFHGWNLISYFQKVN